MPPESSSERAPEAGIVATDQPATQHLKTSGLEIDASNSPASQIDGLKSDNEQRNPTKTENLNIHDHNVGENQTQEDNGQPNTTLLSNDSPFLRLSTEIRLQIYLYVFGGGRLLFKQDGAFFYLEPGAWGRFITSWQSNVLLTCKCCYEEGRKLFVEMTTYGTADDDSNYCLQSMTGKISDFSKAHVSTIAGSVGSMLRRSEFFALLPRLKVCMMHDSDLLDSFHPLLSMLTTANSTADTNGVQANEVMKHLYDPPRCSCKEFLERYGLSQKSRITFIVQNSVDAYDCCDAALGCGSSSCYERTLGEYCPPCDELRKSCVCPPVAVFTINLNKEKVVRGASSLESKEDAIREVLED